MMGQYVRWQGIITLVGIILLTTYLNSINIIQTVVVVPAEGGVFREGLVGKPQLLNPLLAAYNPVDQDIVSLLFEGLTRDDGFGNLEPVLAEAWRVSDDGQVYDFTLRQDIKWSDGEPFTGDDVIFTLNIIGDDNFPGDPSWQRLWQSVEINRLDAYTLQFILPEPFPAFLHYTTVGILPQHILAGTSVQDLLRHPFNLSPIGTGPFKLIEATAHHILLETNPRHHGQPAHIERVEFKFYPDLETLSQAFQNQEVDGISPGSTEILKRLRLQPNLQFFSAPLPRYNLVYFNLQQVESLSFFQDNTIRLALLKLINRQALRDDILAGQAILAKGPILPWNWAHNPNLLYPDYDPDSGLALLAAAGWVDTDDDGIRDQAGRPFAFTLLTNNTPVQRSVADYLAQQWRQAGIVVTVEIVDDGLSQRLAKGQFEAVLIEAQLLGDPDPYPYWHLTQIGDGQNFAGWNNVAASQTLELGRITVDQNERIKQYYAFQDIFVSEMPALILYHPIYTYVVKSTVKNIQLASLVTPSDRFRNIQAWYLLTRRIIETTPYQPLGTVR